MLVLDTARTYHLYCMAHVRYVKLKHARSSLAERYPYLQKEPMYASNKKID